MSGESKSGDKLIDRESVCCITLYLCVYALLHSINDNESCAELLLERMDNDSVNHPDKAGRYASHNELWLTVFCLHVMFISWYWFGYTIYDFF